MEVSELSNKYGIIGILGNYKNTLKISGTLNDIIDKDFLKALKIVNCNVELDKKLQDLTTSEIFRIELATKLHNSTIEIGNISSRLIFKEREEIKKLLKKLNEKYNKKIILVDKDATVFIEFANVICLTKRNEVIYQAKDIYDINLYKNINVPKIVEFTNEINKRKKILDNYTDILELAKAIYRSVS